MRHSRFAIALFAAGLLVVGCETDPSTGVEGTFPITLTYITDTCIGDHGRSEAIEITIERTGDDIAIEVGSVGTLTGTFNPEDRVMTVDGTIQVTDPEGGGTFPGQMHMVARVTEGDVFILGSITFEGTFPGVSGTCERTFEATGERAGGSLSPLPLTGS